MFTDRQRVLSPPIPWLRYRSAKFIWPTSAGCLHEIFRRVLGRVMNSQWLRVDGHVAALIDLKYLRGSPRLLCRVHVCFGVVAVERRVRGLLHGGAQLRGQLGARRRAPGRPGTGAGGDRAGRGSRRAPHGGLLRQPAPRPRMAPTPAGVAGLRVSLRAVRRRHGPRPAPGRVGLQAVLQ